MLERPILFLALWCLFRLTSERQRPGLLSGGFILGYGVFRLGYVAEWGLFIDSTREALLAELPRGKAHADDK
jgi:hypothetical protein